MRNFDSVVKAFEKRLSEVEFDRHAFGAAPSKRYNKGVMLALLWVLGGPEPDDLYEKPMSVILREADKILPGSVAEMLAKAVV